jgi:RHS repeat-associated protein
VRFPGQWDDGETGLYYNRFRYYDPAVGRYISPDPVELLGGLNPYAYALNPNDWIDPYGLADECPPNYQRDPDDPEPTGVPGDPRKPAFLGELAETTGGSSARDSAAVIQSGQARNARAAIGRKTGIKRIDQTNVAPNTPGQQPHAEGDGWSINIDGTRHDPTMKPDPIPKRALEALAEAGWDPPVPGAAGSQK